VLNIRLFIRHAFTAGRLTGFTLLALLFLSPPLLRAQKVNVIEKSLTNGMRILMVERHDDPTISGGWVAHVGSSNEKPGMTGIAHLFAMPMGGQVLLSIRLYLYGPQGAAVVAKVEPAWQAWIKEHFPALLRFLRARGQFAGTRVGLREANFAHQPLDIEVVGGKFTTFRPSSGATFFYLATAKNRLGEEGTKGYRSSSVERPNPTPCP
jgi:hypothetical protein